MFVFDESIKIIEGIAALDGAGLSLVERLNGAIALAWRLELLCAVLAPRKQAPPLALFRALAAKVCELNAIAEMEGKEQLNFSSYDFPAARKIILDNLWVIDDCPFGG
jgi:hypothetical protein